MYKKIFSAILFGVLTIASTSTFVSCKDYDDDINNLQAQITKNAADIAQLQTWYNQGKLITSVDKITSGNGGLLITMSDGNTYTLTNGANGANGVNGANGTDADVWTIDETTGFWKKNGELTNFRAIGVTGSNGAGGVTPHIGDNGNWFIGTTDTGVKAKGENGADGTSGKDGGYYVPNTTDHYGYFDYVDGDGNKSQTDVKWAQNEAGQPGSYYIPYEDGYFYVVTYAKDADGNYVAQAPQKTDLVWSDAAVAGTDLSEKLTSPNRHLQLNMETGNWDLYELDDEGNDTLIEEGVAKAIIEGTLTCVQEENYIRFLNVLNPDGTYTDISIPTKLALKSLVFDPDFYYEGIQAFDIATFTYKALTVNNVNANGSFQNDAPTTGSEFSFTPEMTATYFLNPSNAFVLEDSEKYKFIGYDMPYTRAERTETSGNFNIYEAKVKNGKVTVKANFSGSAIKDIASNKWVSVVALQYNTGDTIVTSDFAAIRANKYTDIHLNLTTKAKGVSRHVTDFQIPSHMYAKAQDAITNDAQIEVAWNSEGLDLREYIQSCRSYQSYSGSASSVDQIWGTNAKDGKVENAGFKYVFELVGYATGASNTRQSAHAAINDDGYTLRPQMPNGGAQAEYGYDQNEAEIGREPLVRVLLKDTVHNKIAAVGYVKIAIVATGEAPHEEETALYIDIDTQTWPYNIKCGDGQFQQLKLTWDQIENQILAKLNMPKSYFEEQYQLDGVVNDNDAADQYDGVLPSSTKITNPFGVVTITTDAQDGNATDTKVLTWVIKNQEAYLAQKNGAQKKTAIVRFSPAAGKTPTPDYFYVRFTWEPSAVNITPETKFGDENKIMTYWYKANTAENTGYDEIHGSVETVGTDVTIMDPATLDKVDSYANDEFVFDIRNTLVGHQLTVDPLSSPYNVLTNIENSFVFVTGNGLFASAAGDALYAENTLTNKVATIDPATGVIRYETSSKALSLLNKADHSDLAGSVTALVNVKSVACSGSTGVSNIAVTVKENAFNVKFLRPIDIKDGQAHFVDAATGGDDAPVELTFVDWRNHNFINNTVTRGFNYFTYYGVRKIVLKLADAQTDMTGSWKKLKTVAPNFKLEYTEPTYYPAAADPNGYTRSGGPFVMPNEYGTLHYDNNGSTMGGAHINIPVEITYDWGVVAAEVVCSFDKTVDNVKRK